jgi:AhpD family alkylhydroperoxidase
MSEIVKEFNDYREKMNEVILSKNNLVMKRLWNLDTNTYDDGALDKKTKEMLGLVASMVLRCDDCIKYHLGKSHELGVNTEQMYEIFDCYSSYAPCSRILGGFTSRINIDLLSPETQTKYEVSKVTTVQLHCCVAFIMLCIASL